MLPVLWIWLTLPPLNDLPLAAQTMEGEEPPTRIETYHDLMSRGKKDEAYAMLLSWHAETPDDPELLLTLCSYYVNRNRREFVHVSPSAGGDTSMILSGPDTSPCGNPTGRIIYDARDVRTGLTHLEKGLKKYPDRLDMHLEKIRILGEIRDLNRLKRAMTDTLNRSRKNKNRWLGPGNLPVEGGKNIMLNGIQEWVSEYIRLMRYDHARTVSELMMRLYPDITFSYNNLGVISFREGHGDRALEYFRRAERINPGDCLVLNNIARLYEKQGNRKLALVYYRRLEEKGDGPIRQEAGERIRILTSSPKEDPPAVSSTSSPVPGR